MTEVRGDATETSDKPDCVCENNTFSLPESEIVEILYTSALQESLVIICSENLSCRDCPLDFDDRIFRIHRTRHDRNASPLHVSHLSSAIRAAGPHTLDTNGRCENSPHSGRAHLSFFAASCCDMMMKMFSVMEQGEEDVPIIKILTRF